jgi:anti-sigma regulatory factor (Ser/Thr protein kinase)
LKLEEYRHEAMFYVGDDDFVASTLPFLEGAVGAAEPTLVVVSAAKIAALRDALGADADWINFADMAEVGRNPARIIPLWDGFIRERGASGRRLRGLGEPVWSTRSPAEIAECQRHEALLNTAFTDPAMWLMCPYDVETLSPDVLMEARRNHPYVCQAGVTLRSASFPGAQELVEQFFDPLPDPPHDARKVRFTARNLAETRIVLTQSAGHAGLEVDRTNDMVTAVNEVTTNSLQHGGGRGTLLVWHDAESVICEVRDRGRMDDPMVDRVRPDLESMRGRGLWLANQLCDLVQIRSADAGTSVRLHMRLP